MEGFQPAIPLPLHRSWAELYALFQQIASASREFSVTAATFTCSLH
jgi:hypothetical protein